MRALAIFSLTVISLLAPRFVFATSEIEVANYQDLQRLIGMNSSFENRLGRKLRLAILDSSFAGYESTKLPTKTKFIDLRPKGTKEPKIAHGLYMARLVYEFLTDQGQRSDLDFELTLIATTGYTDFKNAIDHVIKNRMDLVLNANVREYGGNFDGAGFFNAQLSRAARAGVLWVNAAGNFAQSVVNMSPLQINKDHWVEFLGPNQSLPFRCVPPKDQSVCQVRIVLSWNDFKDVIDIGTEKDLDLILTDDTLNIIGGSYLTQTKDLTAGAGYSLYPREILEMELKAGRYFIRVKDRSQNFTSRDALRVAIDDINSILDYKDARENLMVWADNSNVITVGASDSDRSSKSEKRGKPEVYAPSIVELDSGERFAGSSNASALVMAKLMSLIYDSGVIYGREEAIEVLNSALHDAAINAGANRPTRPAPPSQQKEKEEGEPIPSNTALTLKELGFAPARGASCFQVVGRVPVPPYVSDVLALGGYLVATTLGTKVLVQENPENVLSIARTNRTDMFVASPYGNFVLPRRELKKLKRMDYEVFEEPLDMKLCN